MLWLEGHTRDDLSDWCDWSDPCVLAKKAGALNLDVMLELRL